MGVEMLETMSPTAITNNMIILMPQGDVDGTMETNCWEGQPQYTGTDAWSHDGVQQKAIIEMI